MSLKGKRVIVVGGSAGMGLEVARAAAAEGADVVIASRTKERLDAAKAELGNAVTGVLDGTDEDAVRSFFDLDYVDHIVISAAVVNRKPFFEVTLAEAHQAFEGKFWVHFNVSRHGSRKIRPGGSITMFSGISSRKGFPSLVVQSAINGAVEALCRSLALTLAPVRVNAVCPGFVATPSHDTSPTRKEVLERVAAMLPVKRVGRPEEIAQAVLFLMKNEFATGSVVDVDGGHLA
jgi:NAD(P)-dependent dehydrogenase (short-subunit alcohol dehydrogenase family)